MQLPDNAALARAVAAPVRMPLWRVFVDWDGDEEFAHPLSNVTRWIDEKGVEVERSLTSGIPAEASLVSGYTAAAATITLSGQHEGESLARLMSPYYQGGPFAGVQMLGRTVQVQLGLDTDEGPVFIPQLTGPLRAVDIGGADRKVVLTVSDPSDDLRAPITLPYGSVGGERLTQTRQRYPFDIRSHWLIDYILRRNGYGASLHPGTICSLTCHGSLVAEIGQATTPSGSGVDLAAPGQAWWVEGPHGFLAARGHWAATPPAAVPIICDPIDLSGPGRGIGFSFWAYFGANHQTTVKGAPLFNAYLGPVNGNIDRVSVAVDETGTILARFGPSVLISYASLQASAGNAIGWHYVAGHWAIAGSTTTLTARFDGFTATTTVTTPAWSAAIREFTEVWAAFPVDMSDLTWWSAPTAPATPAEWPGFGYTGADHAGIDPGLNSLTYLPTRTGVDSWSLLQEVAEVEFGVVGFDELGRPFFRDRTTLTADTGTVERTVTARRGLLSLDVGLSSDTVRNVAEFETVSASVYGMVAVFESVTPDMFDTPAFSTREWTVWTAPQTLPFANEIYVPYYSEPDWRAFRDKPVHGWTVVRANETGTAITSNVQVYAGPAGPRRLLIRVVNGTQWPARLADTQNAPALRVAGYPIVLADPELGRVEVPDSINRYRSRTLDLGDSDWFQDSGAIAAVATSLLGELAEPVPVLPAIEVTGDPRVQLGDTLALQDPNGLAAAIEGTVVEIRPRRMSAESGLVDTYGIRPAPLDPP